MCNIYIYIYVPFRWRKMLIQSFVKSQFSYCPLVWMLHSRKANKRINDLHYRALRIVYQGVSSRFDKLLGRDGSYNTSTKHTFSCH